MSYDKTHNDESNQTTDKETEQNNMGLIMDVPVSRYYGTRKGSEGGRRCENCGGAFEPVGAQKFCTHACYSASLRVDIQDRFWSKVNRRGPVQIHCPELGPCWLWTAGTLRGYGQIAGLVNGKRRPVYAHRVSWELANGAIPDGLSVLHRCDVPLCVNPAHLFVGTQPDNLNDARQKGRLIDGLGARKLSDAAYLDILSAPRDYGSGLALAHKYGVTKTTISRIRNGRQGSTYRDAHMIANVEPVPFVHLPIRGEVA